MPGARQATQHRSCRWQGSVCAHHQDALHSIRWHSGPKVSWHVGQRVKAVVAGLHRMDALSNHVFKVPFFDLLVYYLACTTLLITTAAQQLPGQLWPHHQHNASACHS